MSARTRWKADIAGPQFGKYRGWMDQETFVDMLRAVTVDGVSAELIRYWHNPPGRFRSDERTRRSEWISQMSEADRELLEAFGLEAARAALFGVLAVLDGARTIEDPPAGHLELRHIKDGDAQLLASSAADLPVMPLHELLI